MSSIIPMLAGGLILFLYSIWNLSNLLKDIFSERAKHYISKYTNNLFSGILIGALFTFLAGSSSAIIIITIVFINAHTITFKEAMGIIMGANIGTTFSSQVIALDVGGYSFILMTIGLGILFLSRKTGKVRVGKTVLYLGVLFFGLFLMEESVSPLRDSPIFLDWISRLDNPVQGALIGGFVTLIIQSSSATVGLAITLGKQELINVAGGIAVMLGAELGTCSDTLLATIKGRRQAVKAGVFHVSFNLLTIILGLIIFYPFVSLVEFVSQGQEIHKHVANAHMLFNILGVITFLPFVGLFERLLNHIIPEKQSFARSDR